MALANVSVAFFVLGLFALSAYLSRSSAEQLAFVSLVMTVGFLVLFMPVFGHVGYVVPAIGSLAEQGNVEMIQVMDQTFVEPFILIPGFGGLLWASAASRTGSRSGAQGGCGNGADCCSFSPSSSVSPRSLAGRSSS